MSDWDQYVCTLTEASAKKAKEELNEDPVEREDEVKTFLKWIEENSAWLKTPTDTKFLLGFLRNAKFAQLKARKKLVDYWTARCTHPEWFANVDTVKDSKLIECLKMGGLVVLPRRDSEGRAIALTHMESIDTSGKFTYNELMKAWCAILDDVLMDENVQVNGFVIIEDMTHLTIKHEAFFGVEGLKKSFKVWLHSFAARYKAVHYYNTNPVFDTVFSIIKPLFPAKLQRRLHFHGKSLTGLYKHVDQSYLPCEYRPDDFAGDGIGDFKSCIDDQVKKLQQPEVRDRLLRLSTSEYGVNRALEPKDEELFSQSFRKLHTD